MKVLVTLQWRRNVPILTKIKPWISDLKERVKLLDTSTKPARMITTDEIRSDSRSLTLNSNTDALLEVLDYFERWINSAEVVKLKPTWRNLFKMMKDISPELGELAYQIKALFTGKHNNGGPIA